MRKLICLVLVLFALGMLAACGSDDNLNFVYVKQATLYGTTVGTDAVGTSQLVIMDPETGEYIKTIGDVGYYVNGLTYDDTTDTLYATTSSNDPNFANGLITINKTTGAGTEIGNNANYLNCPAVNSLGDMYGWTEETDDLVSIDKATGVFTVVGDAVLSTQSQGLAFDASDVLWLFNGGDGNSYTINTTTGASTYVGTLIDANPIAHHGDFNPVTGYYWGIDDIGVGTKNIRVLDITTNPVTIIDNAIPAIDNLHTLTFGYRSVPVAF